MCIFDVLTIDYLNNPLVQAALHVNPIEWVSCNDPINLRWSELDTASSTIPLYSKIYNHPNKPKCFKMLIFSGDADGVCSTHSTQHWVYDI